MAFIKSLSVVDIVDGRHAGRRGVVREIKIEDSALHVMVWVDVFNLQTGGVELMCFEPSQVKRAALTAAKAERLQVLAMMEAEA